MAPKATFREVYVDIPPSPYTSKKPQHQPQTVKPAPKPRFRPIPAVEIPHSPLWKYTPPKANPSADPSALALKPIASLQMDSNARLAPLREKNAQRSTNNAQGDDKKPAKRKGDFDDVADAKKPRLQITQREPENQPRKAVHQRKESQLGATITEREPSKKRGRPTKAEQAARLASVENAPVLPVPKPVVRRMRKAPPMPQFKSLPYNITKQEAEDRMMMREFFHRFSELLRFPKTHRDALDDFSRPPELNPVKNMLGSLLDILAEDAASQSQKEVMRDARIEIRKSSNPEEIREILEELQDLAPSLPLVLPAFDERETKHKKKAARIGSTTDLIPCVLSLIEFALQGPSIRNDVAAGVEESKSIKAVAEEKIKLEKTIWANVKKTWTDKRDSAIEAKLVAKSKLKEGEQLPAGDDFDLTQWKEAFRVIETKHQTKIRRLQLNLMQQLSTNLLRFTPAGTDLDGRTYWVLSLPAEGVKVPPVEDREEFRRWAWFLAVWVPSSQVSPATSLATSSTAVSDDVSGAWLALGEAKEVRSLIKWLEWKVSEKDREEIAEAEGSALDKAPSNSSDTKKSKQPWRTDMKTLCKRLEDYADFMEWKLGA